MEGDLPIAFRGRRVARQSLVAVERVFALTPALSLEEEERLKNPELLPQARQHFVCHPAAFLHVGKAGEYEL